MFTKTKEDEYNGWTNYETWSVALWMGECEGTMRAVESSKDLPAEERRDEVRSIVNYFVEANTHEADSNCYGLLWQLVNEEEGTVEDEEDNSFTYSSDTLNRLISVVDVEEIVESYCELEWSAQ